MNDPKTMGENSFKSLDTGVSLSYEDTLKEALQAAMRANESVVLLGNSYAGKTFAIKRLKRDGFLPDEYRHITVPNEPLDKVNAQILKEKLKDKTILEGSRYQIGYILGGGQLANKPSDLNRWRKWVKRKNESHGNASKPSEANRWLKWVKQKIVGHWNIEGTNLESSYPKVKFVEAKLDLSDAFNLFHYYADCIEKTNPGISYYSKSELEKKRDYFLSLASLGEPPSEKDARNEGLLIPPLLSKIMEDKAKESTEELAKLVKIEREKEKSVAELFGFTIAATGGIAIETAQAVVGVAKEVLGAVPLISLAGLVLLGTSSLLSFHKEGKERGYAKYVNVSKRWNDLPIEKQRILCENLDEKQTLPPGSSYDFLSSWLSRKSKDDREDEIALRSKLKEVFNEDFISKLQSIIEKVPELEKKLEEQSRRIDEHEKQIRELTQEIQELREDQCAIGTIKVTNEDSLLEELLIPAEGRTISFVGTQELNADKEVIGIVNGTIGDASDRLVVLTGEPGAGKTTLLVLIALSLLASRAKLYFIREPMIFNPIRFQEMEGAYAVVDFNYPSNAVAFFSKLLEYEGKAQQFRRIIVSVRTGYIDKQEMEKMQHDQRFAIKEVRLDEEVLEEVARRGVQSRLPIIGGDDVERISHDLVSKSEGLPLYISEALKLLSDRMEIAKGYNEKMLDDLPKGLEKLVKEILQREERRDPNLLIIYYLVSHTPGLIKEYLEGFRKVYNIEEPRFLVPRPDGELFLHSWYRDIIHEYEAERVMSFGRGTNLDGYLNDLSNILSKRTNDFTPVLTNLLADFRRHPASVNFTDLTDLVMLGTTIYLADANLTRVDSGYGFNILEERIIYKNLKPESIPFFSRFLGFLINGYLSGEPLKEAMSGRIRPFYCLSVFYASRFFAEEMANEVDLDFIYGRSNVGTSLRNVVRYRKNAPYPMRTYLVALSSVLEKVDFFKPSDSYEEALLHYCKGEFEMAIRNFNLAIEQNPNYPDYHYDKGITLIELHRFDDAIREYDAAIELNPSDPAYYNNKGVALDNLFRLDEAVVEFDIAIELDLSDPDYHANKGVGLRHLGRFEDAIKECDKAIMLNPNKPAYHAHKGVALGNLGRFEDAIKELEIAIVLNPIDPAYHSGKGSKLDELQRFDEAIKEYNIAIELEPNDPTYHYNKSVVFRHLCSFDDEIKECDKAIWLDPNEPKYHNSKGVALDNQRMFEDAIREYDIAIGLNPNHQGYHNNKGVTFKNLRRFDDAIREYDIAIGLGTNYPACHGNKSVALKMEDRLQEALEELTIGLTSSPEDSYLLIYYAEIMAGMDLLSDGINKLSAAIKSKPNSRKELCKIAQSELTGDNITEKERTMLKAFLDSYCQLEKET